MKTFIDLLPIILPCIGILISNIVYLIALCKTSSREKILEILKSSILGFMEEAEKFINYTGEEKKQYVFTRVKEFVQTKGIKVKDELIEKYVETFIEFSKQVNAKVGKK